LVKNSLHKGLNNSAFLNAVASLPDRKKNVIYHFEPIVKMREKYKQKDGYRILPEFDFLKKKQPQPNVSIENSRKGRGR